MALYRFGKPSARDTLLGVFGTIKEILIDLDGNVNSTHHRHQYTERVMKFIGRARQLVSKFQNLVEKNPLFRRQAALKNLIAAIVRYRSVLISWIRFYVRFNSVAMGNVTRRTLNVGPAHTEFHYLYDISQKFHDRMDQLIIISKAGNCPSRDMVQELERFRDWAVGFDPQNCKSLSGGLPFDCPYVPFHQISSDIPSERGTTCRVVRKRLSDKAIAETSLRRANDADGLLVMEKVVNLYRNHLDERNDIIVQFCGISARNCRLCLLTEWADKGDLHRHMVNEPGKMNWVDRVRLTLEIATAVKFLHKRNIAHLDLRSSNILLFLTGNRLQAKLSNFKYCQRIIDGTKMQATLATRPSFHQRWMAPELLRKSGSRNLGLKCDTYGLAILMSEIAEGTGKLPHSNVKKMVRQHVLSGCSNCNHIPQMPFWAMPYVTLMQSMWQQDLDSRPDLDEVRSELDELYSKSPTKYMTI